MKHDYERIKCYKINFNVLITAVAAKENCFQDLQDNPAAGADFLNVDNR